jgi:DNA-binding transcriptional ArsR family regulator
MARSGTSSGPTHRRAASRNAEVDAQLIKVLGHPVRARILRVMSDRPASPKEIAEQLHEPLSNISYHVRVLLDAGCLELVGTTPRRGAVEHHYRALRRPDVAEGEWHELTGRQRRAVAAQSLERLASTAGVAVSDGYFDESEALALWTELDLDAAGSQELTRLVGRFVAGVQRLEAKAQARAQRTASGEPLIRARVGLFRFREP